MLVGAVIAFVVIMTPTLSAQGATRSSSTENSNIVNSVSGDRLLGTVNELAQFGTRAFYTNSSWNSSTYLHDRLESLGLWVYYQDFEVSGYQARNVIAVKNGSEPTARQYLFGAHYDSANRDVKNFSDGESYPAPGADDDASGVAAVIEFAEILHDKILNSTTKFVAFSAEETGLNGSAYFVQSESAAGVAYAGTAILDMIGYRTNPNNQAMIFSDYSTNALAASIFTAVDNFDLNISITVVPGHALGYSDHASFWQAGYPSLLVIEELVGQSVAYPYYHTSEDTPNHLSEDQMVEISKAVLGGFVLLENPSPRETSSMLTIIAVIAVVAIIVLLVAILYVRHREVRE